MIIMLIPCAEVKSSENVGAQECRETFKNECFSIGQEAKILLINSSDMFKTFIVGCK